MFGFLDDVRLAARRLWQQPGFTTIATLTLALGLGANTAIFTLIHAVALDAMPVDRPGELVRLGDNADCCVNSGLAGDTSLFSFQLYQHLRDHTPELTALTAFQANTTPVGLRRSASSAAEAVPSEFVTGNYFSTLGVRPALGRLLTADDDEPAAAPVVVLSYAVWRDRYGLDPSIVGGPMLVGGRAMTVAGVTDAAFYGDTKRADPVGVWIPMGQEPAIRASSSLLQRGDQNWLYAIGRMAPGASRTALAVDATNAMRQWLSSQSFIPDRYRSEIATQHIEVVSGAGGVGTLWLNFGSNLETLFAMSGLVLLIAAANLANLLLARVDRGEAAIRVALGASRARLVRQSLAGGLLLALIGSVVGWFVASLATRAIVALAFPGSTGLSIDPAPSPLVLLFSTCLALLTGLVFTAAPAWAMSRTSPRDALGDAGRATGGRSFVPRRSLVIAQVALSLILLSSAGLLTRSLARLQQQPLGFSADRRLVVYVDPTVLASKGEELPSLYASLQERVAAVPGVTGAAYSLYSPMEGNNWSSGISIDGRPADPSKPDSASWNRVGPRYFETLGTAVVAGRAIDDRDTPGSTHVAVVNQTFARRFFPGANPIGRHLGFGGIEHAHDYEIVGVVSDVKYSQADQDTKPMFFMPALQVVKYDDAGQENVQARSTRMRTIVLSVQSAAGAIEPLVRKAIADVNPDLTVLRVRPMDQQVALNFRLNRLMASLASAYGLVALALATLGLYGVTAFGVARRTREIGVRMALGANRADILRHVLGGALGQTAIGLLIGIPAALFAMRWLSSMLFDVSARDPWTFGLVALALIACTAIAAAIPARRAATLDPTKALRTQ